MALDSEERELLRSSFRTVSRSGPQAANRFYEILFGISPSIRALFVNDLEQQGAQFISKLGLIVADLQNVDSLVPVLEDLALRHVAYGVRPEHYALVGRALQQMLAEVLEDEFTPETREAWAKAYAEISGLMIRSAYSHDAARRRV